MVDQRGDPTSSALNLTLGSCAQAATSLVVDVGFGVASPGGPSSRSPPLLSSPERDGVRSIGRGLGFIGGTLRVQAAKGRVPGAPDDAIIWCTRQGRPASVRDR